MLKSTLNGTKKKAIKTSGFRARLKTKKGQNVLKRRKLKKRWKIAL